MIFSHEHARGHETLPGSFDDAFCGFFAAWFRGCDAKKG